MSYENQGIYQMKINVSEMFFFLIEDISFFPKSYFFFIADNNLFYMMALWKDKQVTFIPLEASNIKCIFICV